MRLATYHPRGKGQELIWLATMNFVIFAVYPGLFDDLMDT
jgi:hypothetical protein